MPDVLRQTSSVPQLPGRSALAISGSSGAGLAAMFSRYEPRARHGAAAVPAGIDGTVPFRGAARMTLPGRPSTGGGRQPAAGTIARALPGQGRNRNTATAVEEHAGRGG